jgi:hypothetical protein
MSRFENLIAAIDGSGPTEQMVHTLLSLPAFAQCHVTLLHAVPVPDLCRGDAGCLAKGAGTAEPKPCRLSPPPQG